MFKCMFAKRTVDEREKRKYDHGKAGHTWSTDDASMVVYYYLSSQDWPKYAIQPEVSASLRIVAVFSDKGSGAISTKSGWLLFLFARWSSTKDPSRREREKKRVIVCQCGRPQHIKKESVAQHSAEQINTSPVPGKRKGKKLPLHG